VFRTISFCPCGCTTSAHRARFDSSGDFVEGTFDFFAESRRRPLTRRPRSVRVLYRPECYRDSRSTSRGAPPTLEVGGAPFDRLLVARHFAGARNYDRYEADIGFGVGHKPIYGTRLSNDQSPMCATYGLPVAVIGGGPVVAGSSRASSVLRPAGKQQPTGLLHPGLSTDRSPSPPLDMTTTVTGLLCWQDFHPLRWQLASLHRSR